MTARSPDPGALGVGAVILAAGAGTRLGGVAKALLPHAGKSYLEAIASAARAVGLVDAVVVVGAPFAADVAAHARQLDLRIRINPAPERGMASSVALGFAAIGNGPAAAAWLWPVDHPAVQPETLRRLIEALAARDGRTVAQPRHRGAGGHPPLIRRALWPALAACAGHPDGARGVLRAADPIAVEVDDPGVVRDVDTPADLEPGA
ncbi:MAG TPA: nucleotidyltransferase family protein [Kofleriaceae bacterium]|nr:nucleotidyltransferase family protein [Kofleriaceae bacterium]